MQLLGTAPPLLLDKTEYLTQTQRTVPAHHSPTVWETMIVLQYHREYWADLFMDPIQYFVILNDRDYLLKQQQTARTFTSTTLSSTTNVYIVIRIIHSIWSTSGYSKFTEQGTQFLTNLFRRAAVQPLHKFLSICLHPPFQHVHSRPAGRLQDSLPWMVSVHAYSKQASEWTLHSTVKRKWALFGNSVWTLPSVALLLAVQKKMGIIWEFSMNFALCC